MCATSTIRTESWMKLKKEENRGMCFIKLYLWHVIMGNEVNAINYKINEWNFVGNDSPLNFSVDLNFIDSHLTLMDGSICRHTTPRPHHTTHACHDFECRTQFFFSLDLFHYSLFAMKFFFIIIIIAIVLTLSTAFLFVHSSITQSVCLMHGRHGIFFFVHVAWDTHEYT